MSQRYHNHDDDGDDDDVVITAAPAPVEREVPWGRLALGAVLAVGFIIIALVLWDRNDDAEAATQQVVGLTADDIAAAVARGVAPIATQAADTSQRLTALEDNSNAVIAASNGGTDPTATAAAPEPTATVPVGTAPTTPEPNACQDADKIGTWSEGNAPHRIEVGGHGIQHFDFYPQPGVKSVSYVFDPGIADPDGIPDIAWGYGSLWEWNPPGCAYGLVADATSYALARLDSGHSGLVVEWGTWRIVANVAGLDQSQVDALLTEHRAAFGDDAAVVSATPLVSGVADCIAVRDGDADGRTLVVPEGMTYVVEAWAPRKELMVFPAGKTIEGVKGALWVYPCNSEAVMASETAAGKSPVQQ